MTDLAAVPAPLHALLYGKRKHRRHQVSLEARVDGPWTALVARAVDLSAGGVLLRMDVNQLTDEGPIDTGLLAIQRRLGGHFELRFPNSDVQSRAEVVRVAWEPNESDRLYVGCHFDRPLQEFSLRELGLDPTTCGSERPDVPSDCLPLCAAEATVSVQIFDGMTDYDEPLYLGDIVGIGQQALAAHLDGVSLPEASTCLGSRRLQLRVVQGDDELWRVGARLLAVRQREAPEGGVELALLADSPPVRGLRRRFVRRRRRKMRA